ncbi:TPA: N-acetylmuramoyl-L-alanine amidase, partial [Candidatus Bipolaricaulota bacterium]|nr:N-acetylmuramoyl-L-alanine amidase [Candidatus Bipolaricaulota bacterium]
MAKLGILFLALAVWLLVFALSAGDGALPDVPPLFTVVVDAGHGGKDPGAQVGAVEEKDINLAIALRLFALAKRYPQLRVVLTRASNRYVDLVDRVRLAEEVGAVLYVSIHANFISDPSVCGV